MEKLKYSRAVIEITEFETEDIITTSGLLPGDEKQEPVGGNDDLELL